MPLALAVLPLALAPLSLPLAAWPFPLPPLALVPLVPLALVCLCLSLPVAGSSLARWLEAAVLAWPDAAAVDGLVVVAVVWWVAGAVGCARGGADSFWPLPVEMSTTPPHANSPMTMAAMATTTVIGTAPVELFVLHRCRDHRRRAGPGERGAGPAATPEVRLFPVMRLV